MGWQEDLYGYAYKSQKTKNAAAKRKATNDKKKEYQQQAYERAFTSGVQDYAQKNNMKYSDDLQQAAKMYYQNKDSHAKFVQDSVNESATRNRAELKSSANFTAKNPDSLEEYNAARKKMGLQSKDLITSKEYNNMFGSDKTGDTGMLNRYQSYLDSKSSKDLKVNHNEKKEKAKEPSFFDKIGKGGKHLLQEMGFINQPKNEVNPDIVNTINSQHITSGGLVNLPTKQKDPKNKKELIDQLTNKDLKGQTLDKEKVKKDAHFNNQVGENVVNTLGMNLPSVLQHAITGENPKYLQNEAARKEGETIGNGGNAALMLGGIGAIAEAGAKVGVKQLAKNFISKKGLVSAGIAGGAGAAGGYLQNKQEKNLGVDLSGKQQTENIIKNAAIGALFGKLLASHGSVPKALEQTAKETNTSINEVEQIVSKGNQNRLMLPEPKKPVDRQQISDILQAMKDEGYKNQEVPKQLTEKQYNEAMSGINDAKEQQVWDEIKQGYEQPNHTEADLQKAAAEIANNRMIDGRTQKEYQDLYHEFIDHVKQSGTPIKNEADIIGPTEYQKDKIIPNLMETFDKKNGSVRDTAKLDDFMKELDAIGADELKQLPEATKTGDISKIMKLQKSLENKHSKNVSESIKQQKADLDQVKEIERMAFNDKTYVKNAKDYQEGKFIDYINKEAAFDGHKKMANEYEQIKKSLPGGKLNIPKENMNDWKDILPKGSFAAAGKGMGDDIYKIADNLGFKSVDDFVNYYAKAYESHQIVKDGKLKFVGKPETTPEDHVNNLWEMSPENNRYKENLRALNDMKKSNEFRGIQEIPHSNKAPMKAVEEAAAKLNMSPEDLNKIVEEADVRNQLATEGATTSKVIPGASQMDQLESAWSQFAGPDNQFTLDELINRAFDGYKKPDTNAYKTEAGPKLPHQIEADNKIKNLVEGLNKKEAAAPSKVNVKDFANGKAMKIEDRMKANKQAADMDKFKNVAKLIEKSGKSFDDFSKSQLEEMYQTGKLPKSEPIKPQPKGKVEAEHIDSEPKGKMSPEDAPLHKLTSQEKKLAEAEPMPEGYDAVKHISEQINHDAKEMTKKPLMQKIKDISNKFYYTMVDDKHGVARTDKAAGKNIEDHDSAIALAHQAAGSGEKARQALEKGVMDENGKKIGKSFQEILKESKDPDKLERYLVAKGILDYDDKGMIAIKTNGIKQRDIANSAISELEKEYPHIKEEAKEVYKFIDQQQQVLKEGGLLNQAQIDQMKKDNPNYIGFNRVMDEEGPESFVTGKDGLRKRLANVGNPINKRTGSEKPIVSPFQTLVKRQYVYTNMADRNKAGAAILNNLRSLGEDNIFGTVVDKEENAIYKLMKQADDVADGSEETLHSSINEMFSKKEGKNNLIYVYEDGHKYTIQVHDKLLFDSVMAMDQKAIPVWMKAINAPVRMLRAGVTLSPDFGLRNFARDQITTAVTSKNNFIPIVDSIRGAAEIIKGRKGNSELVNAFTRNGGDMSILQNIDQQGIIKSYQDLRGKSVKQKLIETLKSPIKTIDATVKPLRKVGEFSEKATRIGHMAKAVKQGKSMEQAAYEARSTMDFNRAGAWGRQINQTVAFFNASIQGLDVTARAIAKRPIPTLTKIGAYVVAPSVGLYYLNHNQQWYKDIPDEDKDRNWFIKTPGKDGEIIKIPKPFEVGILFGAGVERALRAGVDGEKGSFNGYAKELFDTMTPDVLPTVLKPLIEVATNYDLFTNNNIESMGDKGLPAEDRKTAYNSQIAGGISKLLSKMNGHNQISPKDIDHLIKGYTGTLGSYASEGVDMIAGALDKNIPAKPSRGAQTAPFIRSFVQKNLEGNNKPTNDFYQLHDDLNTMSQRKGFKYGAQKKSVDRIFGKIQKLQSEKKDILNSHSYNGKTKTKKLNDLNIKITEMARQANKENSIK